MLFTRTNDAKTNKVGSVCREYRLTCWVVLALHAPLASLAGIYLVSAGYRPNHKTVLWEEHNTKVFLAKCESTGLSQNTGLLKPATERESDRTAA